MRIADRGSPAGITHDRAVHRAQKCGPYRDLGAPRPLGCGVLLRHGRPSASGIMMQQTGVPRRTVHATSRPIEKVLVLDVRHQGLVLRTNNPRARCSSERDHMLVVGSTRLRRTEPQLLGIDDLVVDRVSSAGAHSLDEESPSRLVPGELATVLGPAKNKVAVAIWIGKPTEQTDVCRFRQHRQDITESIRVEDETHAQTPSRRRSSSRKNRRYPSGTSTRLP